MYVYNDITYIVNEVTGEEVTCYAKPLELEEVPLSYAMLSEYDVACRNIQENLHCWTSNSVLVVDTSGSMRAADVWGTRTRLGAVWVAIALDFLATRLESGEGGLTDVISIVTLTKKGTVTFNEEPCSWVLYNKIVRLYNNTRVAPQGHGPFLPGLAKAEALLLRNPNTSCAVSLTFLSDGRPSDVGLAMAVMKNECYECIENKVADLAKQFGRRLTFKAIAIGDYDDFEMLERMVDAANDYGARADFCLPSMTSSALGDAFTSIAASITSTQVELTDMITKKQRQVRHFLRESRYLAGQKISEVSGRDFWIYPLSNVTRKIYTEWIELDCNKKRIYRHKYEKAGLQYSAARYVAFAKGPFGEGAERFAFRLFELAADRRTIVGRAMVAKESRLIHDVEHSDVNGRREFTATFCNWRVVLRRSLMTN